jgi:tetratricopeptide (TPR) repeat protein
MAIRRTLVAGAWLVGAGLLFQPAYGQASGAPRPAVPASMDVAAPPPVRILGKVVLEDKSPPPAPVLIERICGGMAHPEGTTDAKGNIAVDLGHDIIRDPYAIHVQPGIDLAPAEPDHPFMDCAIRASLPGYRADLVSMAAARPVGHPYLGTIVLHYVGKVDGYFISPTTLDAPKDARKFFDKAQEVIRKNKQPEAMQNYQKAVQAYPQYAAAWYELGRLQAAARNVDQAGQSFHAALKADVRYLPPYLQLCALAEETKSWTELADVSRQLLAHDEMDFPQAYFYNGEANYWNQKLAEAEKSARAGLKADTAHQYPQTYQLLASILVKENQPAAAAEQLETYLKLFPAADDVVQVESNLARLKASRPKK